MTADDIDIERVIGDLVAEEHSLRDALARGEIAVEDENARLRDIEARLDQCWDLLRQRRAGRDFGQDPSSATARSTDTVEGYLG